MRPDCYIRLCYNTCLFFKYLAEENNMEAERINQLNNILDDMQSRNNDLRGYL